MNKILLCILSVISAPGLWAQTDWKVEKSNHGIVIETRVTDATPIKEFRAATVVNAPLDTLVAILDRVEDHVDWMTDIEHAERLSVEPEVLHYNISTPFPFADKYIVVDVKKITTDTSHRLEMENCSIEPVNIDDHEKIPTVRGYWQFTQIDDSTTQVVYQFLSDPGIKMPDWLVNMFIVNNPYKTLRSLKKRLERS